MKKLNKLGILLSSIAMAAGVITFSSSKLNQKNNHDELNGAEYIGEVSEEKGPVFYPASYSTDIKDEPFYSTQNTKSFSLMNFSKAPEVYRGESVKVAVIDSGINFNHEDFGDINGVSGTIDSSSGSWLYYKYNLGWTDKLNDTLGHGTNVASVIASQINNLGCAGISPNVDLYVFKVTNSSNGYEWTAINSALQYCIDNHVDVVNMSFQAYEHAVSYGSSSMGASTNCSTVLTTKLNNCYNAGITLVGAAGNYNTNEPSYPASNNHVISVGSLADGSTTQKAGFSNTFGIDLVAPGYVQVADKGSSNAYKGTSGTSFSAPIVTAAIALYKQKYPNATPSEIESALYDSCDEISGNPSWAGHGRLNVDRFLGLDENSPQSISITSPSDDTLELQVGETYQLQYSVEPNTFTGDVEFTTFETGAISVSSSGLITALAEGGDTVSINPVGFSNINDEIDVTVVPKASVEVETYSDSKTVSLSNSKVGTWDISPQTTYCGLYYSGKNSSATISNKSISEFSNFATSTESSLTVYVDGICNSGTNSVKVSTINSSGEVVETSTALTNKLGSGSSPTNAKSVGPFTFTPGTSVTGLKIEIGSKCCVTKISYSYSYTKEITGGGSTTTKALSSISLTGQKTEFSVGETWSFGGTVTANYSDNSTADVTSQATFSGNSTSTSGTKTVTVSYNEGNIIKTATYDITVSAQTVTTYNVTYNGNGNTSGSVPTDSTSYNSGASVTIKGNTGNLAKTNYTFEGWNTKSDGTGTSYTSGDTFTITKNTTLYAIWESSSGGGDGGSEYQYYSGNYYSSITNRQISTGGTTLITALKDLIQPKTAFGYANIWTFNENNDKYPSNYDGTDPLTGNTYPTTNNTQKRGKMWDMYSDQTWMGSSQRCGSYSTIGDAYNREHSLPKSWFGGSDSNQPGTDPNHLFNTDGKVNGMRSNYPYGEVVKDITFDGYTLAGKKAIGFGKLGKNSSGAIVFEPDDAYKGDFARAQMYMATAYYDWNLTQDTYGASCFTYSDGVSTMKSYYINLLTKWSAEDPVSQKEIDRNNAVYNSTQKNRNPFIDHPTWAYKIWGGTKYTWNGKSSGDETINVTSVSLNKTNETISVGENLTLIPTISPDNASNKSVTWSTSNETVATVNNGVVTGVSAGTATITAKTSNNKSATCSVTVKNSGGSTTTEGKWVLMDSQSAFTSGDYYMFISPEYNSTHYYLPAVSTSLSKGNFSSSTSTYVKSVVDPTTLSLSDSGWQLESTTDSKWTIKSVNGTNIYLGLDSDNNGVKTTTSSSNWEIGTGTNTNAGKFTFKTNSRYLCAYTNAGVYGFRSYTGLGTNGTGYLSVYHWESENQTDTPQVTNIELDKPTLSLDKYDNPTSGTLTATVTADEGADTSITWESKDTSVATVTDSGSTATVNAIGEGTTKIIAKAGNKTAECTVSVTANAEYEVVSLELVPKTNSVPYLSGTDGKTTVQATLTATFTEGGSKVVTPDSSNFVVDTTVLGNKTISASYGGKTATALVKVTNSGANIGEGSTTQEVTYKSTISPSTWSSYVTDDTSKDASLTYTIKDENNSAITEKISIYRNHLACSSAGTLQFHKSTAGDIVIKTGIGSIKTISFNGEGDTFSVYVGNSPTSCTTKIELTAKASTASGTSAATSAEYLFEVSGEYEYAKITRDSVSTTSIVSNLSIALKNTKTTGGNYDGDYSTQAKAWANYFIALTGSRSTSGPCSLPEDEKLEALQAVWDDVAEEFNALAVGAKKAFCESEECAEARNHYLYIISKFNSLSKFANDGEGNVLSSKNQSSLLTNFGENNSNIILVAGVALLGATAIGLYFASKKRKED